MITKEFVVQTQGGLHARPASTFVQLARTFGSEITVQCNGRQVDGKSILGLMSLSVQQGQSFSISVHGDDEQSALEKISQTLDWLH